MPDETTALKDSDLIARVEPRNVSTKSVESLPRSQQQHRTQCDQHTEENYRHYKCLSARWGARSSIPCSLDSRRHRQPTGGAAFFRDLTPQVVSAFATRQVICGSSRLRV